MIVDIIINALIIDLLKMVNDIIKDY